MVLDGGVFLRTDLHEPAGDGGAEEGGRVFVGGGCKDARQQQTSRENRPQDQPQEQPQLRRRHDDQ